MRPPKSRPGAISAADRPVTANTVLQALQTGNEKVGAEAARSGGGPATGGGVATASGAGTAANLSQQVPEALRPLVQQQLEAAATQRMLWHGEVWPRQSMDLEIERNTEREADGSGDEDSRWRTTLSLTTPRLGHIEANLQLTLKGVRIALTTPDGASAVDLREAAPQLAAALAAAGVPLLALQVNKANEQPAR